MFPAELIERAVVARPTAELAEPTRLVIGVDLGASPGYAAYVVMTQDAQGRLTMLDSGRASSKRPYCVHCQTEVMEMRSERDMCTGDYVVTVICHGRQETTRIRECDLLEAHGEVTYTECFRDRSEENPPPHR
jgi:hypothetical protein